MIAVAQGIDSLQLADIQHPPHKAAETAALVGDDPQILLFILRRDGTVQNAVRIAMVVIGVFSSWEMLAMNSRR